jgi:hypothetical protein
MIIYSPKTPWQRFKTRLKYWGWWKWKWWLLRKLGDRTNRIIIYRNNLGISIDDIVRTNQICYKANEPTKFDWKWVDLKPITRKPLKAPTQEELDRLIKWHDDNPTDFIKMHQETLEKMEEQTETVKIPPRFGLPERKDND